jgi:hypothetical protein
VLVGSINEVPKVGGTVLDSGRYIAFVVDIVATIIAVVGGVIIGIIKYTRWDVRLWVVQRRLLWRIRIGWISKMSGAAVRDCTRDGVFVIIK